MNKDPKQEFILRVDAIAVFASIIFRIKYQDAPVAVLQHDSDRAVTKGWQTTHQGFSETCNQKNRCNSQKFQLILKT